MNDSMCESIDPSINPPIRCQKYKGHLGEHEAQSYTGQRIWGVGESNRLTPNTLPNNQSDSPTQCESFHPDHTTRCQKYHGHAGDHEVDIIDEGIVSWPNYSDPCFRERAEGIEVQEDPINPSHYRQGQVECIDAIKAALGEAGYKAFLAGQILKYCWRYEHKNGVEDLKKAQWYLNKLVEEFDGQND